MILTCPSCDTQYFADDSSIGDSGRTVKCAACGHSWFVRPEGAEPAKAAPAAHDVYREKVREQRRQKSRLAALVSWIATAAAFFSLGLAAVMFRSEVVKVWPESAIAYQQIGFKVNRFGLEFADVERSRTFNDTIPIVTVTGKAQNVARTTVETPGVRVDLKDEQGRIVATRFSFVTPPELAPGETGAFGIVLEPAPIESFEIVLSFVPRGEVPPDPREDDPGDLLPVPEPILEDGAAPVGEDPL